ncbi:MAG TPA: DUF4143 domain-containing protein, partial [Candidatus Saccharimonadia bacterium]|nr:DUF4143 domain-containing protein [Candidatus Saccharimonadia bacterium]
LLWEHFVLNEMQAHMQAREVRYWRDKRGHEVDFVLARRGQPPLTVECKWSASDADPDPLKAFRRQYPQGKHVVVAHDVERTFSRTYGDTAVQYMNLPAFIEALLGKTRSDSI